MPTDPPVTPGHLQFELVPVPVRDIDRAKAFYVDQVGFTLDVDVEPAPGVRVVQFTPPGSSVSIKLSTGFPKLDMEPGTLRGLHLVVADIDAERNRLIANGVDVAPVEDVRGVQFAYFADPDGNTWTLQHLPWRPIASA